MRAAAASLTHNGFVVLRGAGDSGGGDNGGKGGDGSGGGPPLVPPDLIARLREASDARLAEALRRARDAAGGAMKPSGPRLHYEYKPQAEATAG